MISKTVFLFALAALFSSSALASFPKYFEAPEKTNPNPINPNFTYVEVNKVDTKALNISYPGEFYTGYITVNETSGSKIFYQLYSAGGNKRASTVNDTAPLIMPLAGGPGAPGGNSYYESGPFRVDAINDTMVPVLNEVSWNDEYHLLYVDNPVGVGYSVENNDMPPFSTTNGIYLLNFLKRFFELFPSLKEQLLYALGESYGGHFVLGLATEILNNPDLGIKLTGVGFQDGWYDPYWQGSFWSNAWYATGLIDSKAAAQVDQNIYGFQQAIKAGNFSAAFEFVGPTQDMVPKQVDLQEYRNDSTWDITTMLWLNSPTTKQYLAADPNTLWTTLNLRSFYYLDFPQSYASNVTDMLNNQNITFLFYQGQEDMLVPAGGTQASLNNLGWTEIAKYKEAKNKIWKDTNDNVIGHYKHYDKLTFGLVNKAGHNAAHDQPWSCKNLVDRWIKNDCYIVLWLILSESII